MLGIDVEHPASHCKGIFGQLCKNCKKADVKYFIDKPILPNFVNLSTIFKVLCYFQFLKNIKYIQNVLNQFINPVLSAKTIRILRCSDVFLHNFTLLSTML